MLVIHHDIVKTLFWAIIYEAAPIFWNKNITFTYLLKYRLTGANKPEGSNFDSFL